MYTKQEIKDNLLGCLDVALFMPNASQRFGDSYDQMVKSFYIPIILYPIYLLSVYLSPMKGIESESANMVSFLFSMRIFLSWFLFFGFMYWVTKELKREEYFYKFVIASNWLTIPSTVIFLPSFWLIMNGSFTWTELQPFMMCLVGYTYLFTAYMTARILKAPWEIGGFVVIVGMIIENGTVDLMYWVSDKI